MIGRVRNYNSHNLYPIDTQLQLNIYGSTTCVELALRLFGNRENSSLRRMDSQSESEASLSTVRCRKSSLSFVAFGVASCRLPNRAHCRRRGLGERFEQMFEETRRPNDCRSLAGFASRCGPTRSPTSCLPSASAARSGRHSFTSPATASLPTRPSWPCSTSFARASALEFIVGWSSPVARQAHNLKVVSSNLTPATIFRRAA